MNSDHCCNRFLLLNIHCQIFVLKKSTQVHMIQVYSQCIPKFKIIVPKQDSKEDLYTLHSFSLQASDGADLTLSPHTFGGSSLLCFCLVHMCFLMLSFISGYFSTVTKSDYGRKFMTPRSFTITPGRVLSGDTRVACKYHFQFRTHFIHNFTSETFQYHPGHPVDQSGFIIPLLNF